MPRSRPRPVVPSPARTSGQVSTRATELARSPRHFDSAIPDLALVERTRARIFGPDAEPPGIDLDEEAQVASLGQLRARDAPDLFPERRSPGRRVSFNNHNVGHGEALVPSAVIRNLRSWRVVEVGCGHSSCALFDTRDGMEGPGAVRCTFVEP